MAACASLVDAVIQELLRIGEKSDCSDSIHALIKTSFVPSPYARLPCLFLLRFHPLLVKA